MFMIDGYKIKESLSLSLSSSVRYYLFLLIFVYIYTSEFERENSKTSCFYFSKRTMTRDSYRLKGQNGKRPSCGPPAAMLPQQANNRRMSAFINGNRRLSLASQISVPKGAEYRPQRRLPPNGLESQQNFMLMNLATRIEENSKENAVKPAKKENPTQQGFFSQLCCLFEKENKCEHEVKKLQS